jgi:rhodanese-related sulfurtransferase
VTATRPERELVYPEVPRISPEELKRLMEEGVELVIVDCRGPGSYRARHIKGAVNIPTAPLDPDREMTLILLPMDKMIVPYCD